MLLNNIKSIDIQQDFSFKLSFCQLKQKFKNEQRKHFGKRRVTRPTEK